MEYENFIFESSINIVRTKNLIKYLVTEKDSSHFKEESIIETKPGFFFQEKQKNSINRLNRNIFSPFCVYPFLMDDRKIISREHFAKENIEYITVDNSLPITQLKVEIVFGQNALISFDMKLKESDEKVKIWFHAPTSHVLRWTLKNKTIKNNLICGHWHIINRQNNHELIEKNSVSWKWFKACEEKRKIKSISKDQLQVGKIYKTKEGNPALFIGYVSTATLIPKMNETQSKAFSDKNYKTKEKEINFEGHLRKTKIATMWLKLSSWHLKTYFNTKDKNSSYLIASINKQLSKGNSNNISIMTSHRYMELVDEIPDFAIDAGTFGRIKSNALQEISYYLNDKKDRSSDDYRLYYEWRKITTIGKLSKIANMMPFGMGIQIEPYFSKWDVKRKNS